MTSTAHIETEIREATARIRRAWLARIRPIPAVRPSSSGGGGYAAPAVVPPAAIDARRDVQERVYGWCRHIVETNDLQHATVNQAAIGAMLDLIDTWSTWLSGQDVGPDVAEELTQCAARIEAHAHPTEHVRDAGHRKIALPPRHVIGRCPIAEDADGNPTPPCGGDVVATLDEWGGGDATCRRCKATADLSWWQQWITPEPAVTLRQLVDVVLVEHGIEVGEGQIRGLVDRGLITIVGRDDKGRRLVERSAADVVAKRVTRRAS